jgi:hypothetical protein
MKLFSEIPSGARDLYCYDHPCFREVSNAVSSLVIPMANAISPARGSKP